MDIYLDYCARLDFIDNFIMLHAKQGDMYLLSTDHFSVICMPVWPSTILSTCISLLVYHYHFYTIGHESLSIEERLLWLSG